MNEQPTKSVVYFFLLFMFWDLLNCLIWLIIEPYVNALDFWFLAMILFFQN